MALAVTVKDFNEVLGWFCVVRGPTLYVLDPKSKDFIVSQGTSQGITRLASFCMRVNYGGSVHPIGEISKCRYYIDDLPKAIESIKRIYLKKAQMNG